MTDPPPAPNAFQECLNLDLAAALKAMFSWSDEHGGAQPVPSPAPGRSSCGRLYGAYVDPPTPDGVEIKLEVPGLDENDPVMFVDGQEVVISARFRDGDEGLSTGKIFVPAPIKAHTATIEVQTAFGKLSTTVELPAIGTPGDTTTTTTTTGPPIGPSTTVPSTTIPTTSGTTTPS